MAPSYDNKINLSKFMPGGSGWKKIAPGTRGIAMAASSLPSLAVYGAAGGAFLLFFTSAWFGRNIMEKVPLYNAKYAEKGPD